ncbi:TonB-dependent receptor [Parablastomonas sp. CN1-191]|uniref:TonB-dependent receptor n=1 Tax=Parablastomonas sp. CN1-191 TaxID=3400908 RepID=UPI003BF90C0F
MTSSHARPAASLLALATLIALPATAQAAVSVTTDGVTMDAADAPASPDPQAQTSPEDVAATTDTSGLTDIVVTATKRETNLQKTPIAISVLDAGTIEKRHVESLIDLADGGIPSLRVATFEARQSALTIGIRGIVPFDQNQTAREPGVGVYIDNVYLGRSQGLNAALFDVKRIEVLRGPQGTLFGRNTEGGALSIVTAQPTGVFGGRVSAGVGNYGSKTGEFHINMPAFANIALKFDGVYQHQNATTKNPAEGQYGWNYYNRLGGRVAARWTPIDDLTVDVAYDQARDENTPFYSQLINYNPQGLNVGTYADPVSGAIGTKLFYGGTACNSTTNTCIAPLSPLVQVSGDKRMSVADMGVIQQPSVDKTHGVSSNISYKLTPDLELRSITAWRGVSTHQWDGSAGAHRSAFVPNGQFGRYSLSELFQNQFSQEVQLVGSIPHLDFVLGGYYFTEHAEEAAATPNPEMWNAAGTAYTFVNQVRPNPLAPITSSNQGWERRDWFVQRHSAAKAHSYAAFGQGTFTPGGFEAFHLTLGGRYTHDKRDGYLDLLSMVPTPYTFNYDNSRFDPLVIAALDAAPGVNLYAKYASGFRAGGANARSATFRAFGPESVKSYEIGAKTDFLDHRARFNLAAFIMDRTGTQIDFDFVDTTQFLASGAANPNYNKHTEETVNVAGKSRIKGIEAELTLRPIDTVTLGASYAYTDVKVPAVANPLAGPTFGVLTQVYTVFTPKHAASGYVDVDLPLADDPAGTKLRFHVDANYAGPQYSFQSESVQTQSSFVVNGRIAMADIPMNASGTKATLSLWSRNLLNEDHIYRRSNANGTVIGDYGNFNPPRTFGVEGTISF